MLEDPLNNPIENVEHEENNHPPCTCGYVHYGVVILLSFIAYVGGFISALNWKCVIN